jgi:hypothetical protein
LRLALQRPGGPSGTYYDAGTPVSITANFDIPALPCTMTGDTTANIADVQRVTNAALYSSCLH